MELRRLRLSLHFYLVSLDFSAQNYMISIFLEQIISIQLYNFKYSNLIQINYTQLYSSKIFWIIIIIINVLGWHQSFWQKRNRTENPNKNCGNIQTTYTNEIFIEKYDMQIIKIGKRHIMKGIELPNQVVIRNLGRKWKADTIKQVERKEKFWKIVSQKSQKITREEIIIAGTL